MATVNFMNTDIVIKDEKVTFNRVCQCASCGNLHTSTNCSVCGKSAGAIYGIPKLYEISALTLMHILQKEQDLYEVAA